MKILLINEYGSWGGAEKIFYNSAKAFKEDGHDILCLLGSGGILEEKLQNNEIRVKLYREGRKELKENSFMFMGKRIINVISVFQNYIKLKEDSNNVKIEVDKFKPDIIYLNNLRPLIIFYNIKEIMKNTKVIWHEHGYQRSKIRQFLLDNKLLKYIDKIICVSNHVCSCHSERIKYKTIILNNGIEDIGVKSISLNKSNDFVEFVQPAFITRWKGQNTVLEAVNILINKYKLTNFKVKFLGSPRSKDDSRYLSSLIRYVKINDLYNYVEFLGFRDDAVEIIGKSDMLISSSQEHDPFPTILLEGCCLGKAIISSNAGGSSDIVKHNKNGFVFSMKNGEELAKYMKTLIKNRDLINKYGKESRKIYLQNFTIDNFNNNIVDIISSI
ncbi:spore coat protein SA [Clostridium tepidiprofundi DSM 19306]|uniref:Spore coat protein SA n=1 Tax=Clostridium tepidiprofundi DSM 19306 TaxID=1121338 RepID=A0A151AU81_9CLOT|nr:glycosyltransferase family 4 protein [Clostridium tepidiprofundi]KYH31219.1 spore coat protein SA [Clostridium tepidiprofundi DSM 19306]